jgi:hypothetical protein
MAEIRSYQIEFEDWKAAEFTEKHPSAKKE